MFLDLHRPPFPDIHQGLRHPGPDGRRDLRIRFVQPKVERPVGLGSYSHGIKDQ
jgi:hypothetical protein